MWSSVSLLVGLVLVLVNGQTGAEEGAECTTPGGIPGQCVLVRECSYVWDILRKEQFFANDTQYVQELRCGTHANGFALVCCPRLRNDVRCGPVSFGTRIIGANETTILEFPFLALLRFEARNGKIHANCAGSLIGSRFVLTAAHCFNSAHQKGWKLNSVRVAEWNFMNRMGGRDCRKLKDFDAPLCRKDYGIARFTLHPAYKVNYAVHINDIALIELTSGVEFDRFVAPVCLPLDNLPPPEEYTAVGWGSTSPGSGMNYELMQVELKPFDHRQCRRLFQVASGAGLSEAHLCAGGEHGEDTCHGDSGGPLMELADGRWYLAGITSFGAPKCGREGVPGVYANVSHYLGWIQYEVYRGVLV